ncbi:DNA topoisomerase IV subunit A [[Acholeplasma] multilocale]|uniref:DNA topoisomerase IV subunit A n=1 Tax=[Acholeplasma] multilocale TaxID=264638 RepID=UPI0009FC36F8|nr:DNA topoisomerase IV subunit A [[Acholeplasma] multilocale]
MAKKVMDNSNVENEKGIVVYPLEDLMGDRFGRYAKYIIQERALPDVRDGLKPVQRRILYAMGELKLTNDKAYKKSARVVGEVIGKYHPHGDTSIYDAMVRMSQTWKLGTPLVDMQGNNGSIDGDSAAAMRYTETRLAKISDLMLEDLEKNTVMFAPNFDDSEKEPTVLPSYFPNILANGATGIAAGYATNMPPHNLGEVIDATIKLIKTPNTRLDTILDIVKGPDFPTGGTVQGRDGIRDAFATGKGKVIINSKWHEEKGNIIIDEIPYEVVKQDLVRKIGDVVDANPGLGIREVRDETDRTGLRIAIDLSDKANVETVRKFLFKNSPLSVSYNYNNVVIVDKQPLQLGIIDILKAYIVHYTEIFTRKSQFDLNKAKVRLNIVDGLIRAMSILDLVIATIRKSTNRADAIENLMNVDAVGFNKEQAVAIVDMRLYRLTSTDVVKLQEEKANLELLIAKLTNIINNPEVRDEEIINRLKEVKKQFPTPRRSEVVDFIEDLEVEFKDTLVEKKFNLWVSKDGYLKAIENAVLAKNDMSTFGRKPNDIWISRSEVSNLDHLLLVSSAGTYYSIPLHKLTMSKWKDMGVHLNTVTTMDGNEEIVSVFVIKNFEEATQQIMLTTKLGMIKRVPIIDLATKLFTKSFRIMKLNDGDEVVSASLVTSKTRTCTIVTSKGFGVRYHIEDIPVQGTNSKGVKASNLKDDFIISGKALSDNDAIMIITEKDSMKKIDQNEVPVYIRPKRGTRLLPERKRGSENITFGFSVNQDDIIRVLDSNDEYQEIIVAKAKFLDTSSTTADTGVEGIVAASLENQYTAVNGDLPPESNSGSNEGEEYVSKAELNAKREANKGKVTAKVVATKEVKEAGKAAAAEVKGTDLSDLLGDITSILGSVNANPKSDKEKKAAKAEKEKLQLNFDDLFED